MHGLQSGTKHNIVSPEASLLSRIFKYRSFYLFLFPALLSVLVFNYKPMVGVIMAFEDFDIIKGLYASPFVGLKHFAAFLATPDFYRALKNTLVINLFLFAIGFPLPILFALLVNEIKLKRFKRISQTITYLPHFLSWIVVASMVYKILDQDAGIMNTLISSMGGERIGFMREAKYFWVTLTTTSVWKELGWNSIIYLAAISGIELEMYEAATVDGAGRFKKLLHITLPGIAPTIGLLLILSMGSLVSGHSFDAVYNLGNPMVADASNTLDVYALNEGITWRRYSYAAAIGLTQAVISLGLVLGSNAVSRKLKGYGAF